VDLIVCQPEMARPGRPWGCLLRGINFGNNPLIVSCAASSASASFGKARREIMAVMPPPGCSGSSARTGAMPFSTIFARDHYCSAAMPPTTSIKSGGRVIALAPWLGHGPGSWPPEANVSTLLSRLGLVIAVVYPCWHTASQCEISSQGTLIPLRSTSSSSGVPCDAKETKCALWCWQRLVCLG